jgi:peptidoglycan/LPS O-acetylase OafA/YrhL
MATFGTTVIDPKPPKPSKQVNSIAELSAYVTKLVAISRPHLDSRRPIMPSNTIVPAEVTSKPKSGEEKSSRLYYLDWLRVILLLGVFLYHVIRPFDPLIDWHINNAVKSDTILTILLLVNPWGIPLFFLVAGAASMFALRRRSNRQFISERATRLLIPFIVGSILLTPFQKYLEALHKESFQGSFLSFIPEMLTESISGNLFTPLIFGRWGLHLWFLGFLFVYSLLALPVFRWFERDAGTNFISWLGRSVEIRGGILLFVLPLALARILLQPFFAVEERGWLDFVYFFLFFILGYIIYSDERFLSAILKDRWLLFAGGIAGLATFFGLFAVYGDIAFEWGLTFVVPWSIILIFAFVLMSWGWALDVLYLATKHLNFTNKWLVYGKDTILPFYLLHQPVIIVIAYFVVQWEVGIPLKLLVILISSFFITLGLVELLIRPFKPMRRLFGMKRRRETKASLA